MNPLTERWAQTQRAQGNSERTITSRAQLLGLFEAFIGRNPAEATADDVIDFMADCRRRDLSRSTRAAYFSHLRAWHRWLVAAGARQDDPTVTLVAPKIPRRRPRPVSDEQLARILATPMHRRSRLMVMLAAYQGLRVHEIAKISGDDVNLLDFELRVRGKGDEEYILPLHRSVAQLATEFPRHGFWFTTHVGNRFEVEHILGKSVSAIIGNVMTRAEVDGGAHRLRHWYGTKLIEMGVDSRIVQELLRHASLQTTQVYTRVTLAQQRAAIARLEVPPAPVDDDPPIPPSPAVIAA